MERESFEDPAVASLLNDGFVSIKVDREERPDLDAFYMTVCQLMAGQGGWPLTIVMTPERAPFFAGTYVPRETRYGRVGMLELLPRLRALWQERRPDLEASAVAAVEAVRELEARSSAAAGDAAGEETLARGFRDLEGRFDPSEGGFGGAPKFPTPHQLLFLLRYHARTGEPSALGMVETTLTRMRRGGIFDHVGFGFHRYSTDARWQVPHFEKMLYDQALMTLACVEAWEATRNDRYRRTAEEILAYVRRDLAHPDGGFCSAEDADSEGREGKFYVWTREEFDGVLVPALGEDEAAFARRAFGVETGGNFAEESTGALTGENILHRRASIAELAAAEGCSVEEVARRLERIRSLLADARARRPRPLLDDKVLTDWNGLMIAAFAAAARATGEEGLAAPAVRAARFVLDRLRAPDGRLLHRYREGEAAILATAADHAFLAWGLLELYGATFDPAWLQTASWLASELCERFADGEGGFFTSANDVTDVPVRQKEVYDGAMPSANAASWYVFLRLWQHTGDSAWRDRADRLAAAFGPVIRKSPAAHTMWLVDLDLSLGPWAGIVIAGHAREEGTRRLVKAARSFYRPRDAVLLHEPGASGEALARIAPFTAGHGPVNGKAAAWVCSEFACQRPTTEASEIVGLLGPPPASP